MPGQVSEYERIRLKNIEDNRKILAELGLMNPFGPAPRVIKKTVKRSRPLSSPAPAPKKRKVEDDEDARKSLGSVHGTRRRSARFRGQEPKSPAQIKEDVENEEEDEDYKPRVKIPPNRENVFGAIPGVEIGTLWEMRLECCAAGVHRPTVSGIHGGPDGAYSIALSGGYEDDIDMGEFFTYTGQGGRDLKGTSSNPKNLRTAPQSKDQTLQHGNLALSRNVATGHPVRVIRGYKLKSAYATDWGYRYDGLYSVEKFWFTTGLSGYGVYKFALRRLKDQAPPPWEYDESVKEEKCSQDSGIASDKSDVASETSDPPSQQAELTEQQETDSQESVRAEKDVEDIPDVDESKDEEMFEDATETLQSTEKTENSSSRNEAEESETEDQEKETEGKTSEVDEKEEKTLKDEPEETKTDVENKENEMNNNEIKVVNNNIEVKPVVEETSN